MSTPDEIRADIERTRGQMSDDVDLLADTANPKNIARRQAAKVGGRFSAARDRVMGSGGPSGSASDALHSAADAAGDVPHQARRQVQGSPLAAGLIAFGAGALVAALLPSSDREREAAAQLKDQAQPLVDEAKQVAQQAGERLKPAAQDAVEEVKQTATDAAQTVKGEGQQAAQDVQSDARGAADEVRSSSS